MALASFAMYSIFYITKGERGVKYFGHYILN